LNKATFKFPMEKLKGLSTLSFIIMTNLTQILIKMPYECLTEANYNLRFQTKSRISKTDTLSQLGTKYAN
jgi:hypothetical protein